MIELGGFATAPHHQVTCLSRPLGLSGVEPTLSWNPLLSKSPGRVLNAMAFHEKAGRSQEGSFVFSLTSFFLPCRVAAVATLPPHSSVSDFCFARCQLGVLQRGKITRT